MIAHVYYIPTSFAFLYGIIINFFNFDLRGYKFGFTLIKSFRLFAFHFRLIRVHAHP